MFHQILVDHTLKMQGELKMREKSMSNCPPGVLLLSMHPLLHRTIMMNNISIIMFIIIIMKLVHQGFYHSLCIPSFIEQDRVSGFWTWMFVLSKVTMVMMMMVMMMIKQKCFYYYCKLLMLLYMRLNQVPELGDTVFIVLRKQQLIFLHW